MYLAVLNADNEVFAIAADSAGEDTNWEADRMNAWMSDPRVATVEVRDDQDRPRLIGHGPLSTERP